MRKLLSAASALAIALVLVACTPEEASHLDGINALREANGLPALTWEEGAYAKARTWSQKMADDGRLSHSKLSDGMPAGWRTLGENVAYNGSVQGALEALKKSPGHRANMLNPKFNRVAVGIVEQGGRYWVTQVFLG